MKLLWVMNVTEVGGTALWVLDALRTLRLFSHEVVFLKGEESPAVGEAFRTAGASLSKADRLTPELVEAVAPRAVVLSNADPEHLAGEHPWGWLTGRWLTVYVHHGPVHPWLPGAAADVFLSRYLEAQYENLFDRMNRRIVVPAAIRTWDYATVARDGARPVTIGRHSSGHAGKYPPELLSILMEVGAPAEIVGGAPFYPHADPALFAFPPIGSASAAEFLARWDVFVYRCGTWVETWGRAVTEAMASGLPCVVERRGALPEQIEDGVDGFLCDDDREFVDRLRLLAKSPALRREMGERARLKALRFFDVSRFRDELETLLVYGEPE